MQEAEYEGGELGLFREASRWKAYFCSQLEPYMRGDILEVGAGIGSTTRALWTRSVRSWTCLEPSSNLIEELEHELESVVNDDGNRPSVQNRTLRDLEASPQFDSILYIDVLEHIQHDRDEVAHAVSLLRTGGHLIVLSPAHNWLFSPFDEQVGHFRRYDRRGFADLTPPGAKLTRVRYLDSVGIAASLANRMLLRESLPTPAQIRTWDRFLVPLSRLLDPFLGYRLGKTIIGFWTRD